MITYWDEDIDIVSRKYRTERAKQNAIIRQLEELQASASTLAVVAGKRRAYLIDNDLSDTMVVELDEIIEAVNRLVEV